jgi:hypothetical protein
LSISSRSWPTVHRRLGCPCMTFSMISSIEGPPPRPRRRPRRRATTTARRTLEDPEMEAAATARPRICCNRVRSASRLSTIRSSS